MFGVEGDEVPVVPLVVVGLVERSQWASFLTKKAHFSSNWTSAVRGGNRHELVEGVPGMPSGDPVVAGDRIGVHPAGPTGLANAAPLGDVLQDRIDLLRRNMLRALSGP